jgi:preprotein translocase subunit SecA
MLFLGFHYDDADKKEFQNQFIEIPTGQGKSIVFGILACLFAILGYQVHVACYSKLLSERDYDDLKQLIRALSIEKLIYYGTF